MKSQRDAIPKITFEYSLTKSLKKYEIPDTKNNKKGICN
jgi:hypothetical protein